MSELDSPDISTKSQHIESYGPALESRSSERKKPEREGLPPGYRMRADAHYVDQLTSRPSTPSASELPVAALSTSIAESLAAIESAAAALSNDASTMSRRVNLDLIKAHAWRAGWILRAHDAAQRTQKVQVRNRPIGFLVDHIRSGFMPECRLNGIGLRIQASDWNAIVAVDERAFLSGVAAGVLATMAVLEDAEQATITLTVASTTGEPPTVEISQEAAPMAAEAASRFFDPNVDRPGGPIAQLAVDTARSAARRHGGDAVCAVGDRGGTILRMTFG